MSATPNTTEIANLSALFVNNYFFFNHSYFPGATMLQQNKYLIFQLLIPV